MNTCSIIFFSFIFGSDPSRNPLLSYSIRTFIPLLKKPHNKEVLIQTNFVMPGLHSNGWLLKPSCSLIPLIDRYVTTTESISCLFSYLLDVAAVFSCHVALFGFWRKVSASTVSSCFCRNLKWYWNVQRMSGRDALNPYCISTELKTRSASLNKLEITLFY